MQMTKLFNSALSAALLLGCFTVAAAQNTQTPPASAQATTQGQSGQTMYQVLPGTKQVITGSDRQQVQIAREVRHELAMLPYYTIFDDLTYRVDGTTVTLGGDTITVGLKRDAESAVKKIEGVTRVVNNIKELPPFDADQQIRYAVARKIFSFGNLSRYGWEAAPTIHIVVSGGHVRLEGVVDSQADKDAAGVQANQVPGVFSVQNNLQVIQRPQR